jgi:hypothetical protein
LLRRQAILFNSQSGVLSQVLASCDMANRQFKPDLTGSDETLERLLERLRAFNPRLPHGPDLPPGYDHFVTSRRPPRGAGGAEAPVPSDRGLKDLYAPI